MKILTVLTIALLMVGCAHESKITRDLTDANQRVEAVAREGRSTGEVLYQRIDTPWLGDEVVPHAVESEATQQPTTLDQAVNLSIDGTLTLQVFAGMMQEAAGLPVVLGNDIPADDAKSTIVLLPDHGRVRDYLDHAASQTGTHWSYDDGRVLISRMVTRTFAVPMLPVDSSLRGIITNATTTAQSASGGGGGGQGGEGGGQGGGQSGVTGGSSGINTKLETSQISETTAELDPWSDLKLALEQLKSPTGSVAVARSLGTVTVRDTPESMRSIEDFIEQLSESRFVAIDVTILTLDMKDANAVGIDWNLMRAAAGDFYGAALSGANDGPLAAVRGGFTVIDPRSPYADSSIFIEALREQGNVNISRAVTLTALSNQVASIQRGDERGLIEGSQQTVVPNVGVTTTATVSRQTTGISLDILPVVLANQQIQLHVQGQLSTDNGEDILAVGESSFRSPRTSKGSFSNRGVMPSGGTLVLSSIDEQTLTDQQRGVGSPKFSLLGGGRNTSRERRLLVILITPRRIG